MIKGAIFDLDNTLVDSIETICRTADYAMRTNGYKGVDIKTAEKAMGLTIFDLFKLVEPDLSENEKQKLFHCYKGSYMKFIDKTEILPNVRETLSRVRAMGIRMALVTTKSRENAVKILKAFDLLDYFEFTHGFEDTWEHKPSAEPMTKAIARMGLHPSEVVVIGDSDADVRSGRSAGAKVIAVTTGVTPLDRIQAERPDHIIGNISKVPAIICNENRENELIFNEMRGSNGTSY